MRYPCTYTSCGGGDLSVDINVSGISLNTGTDYKVEISTEFVAPLNGLKYPTNPGYYYIILKELNAGGVEISKYSDYIYIQGKPAANFKVTSLSRTINQFNIFTVDVTTVTALNAFNHATSPGRIYL